MTILTLNCNSLGLFFIYIFLFFLLKIYSQLVFVLFKFYRVRFHYGHPDIFDRIFHVTRGGVSKASKTINLSEDIFSGGTVFL